MHKSVSIIGCGFVGQPLALQLVKEGYKVYGTSTTHEKIERLWENKVEAYHLEVNEEELIGNIPQDVWEADAVVITIPPNRRNPADVASYPKRIKRVLEKIADHGTTKTVFFTSSTGVYGDQNELLTEESVLQPKRITAKACALAEQYFLSFSTTAIILRLSGLIGGERPAGRFLAGKSNIPNGGIPVNLVLVEDVVGVISNLLKRKNRSEIYNICADEHPSRSVFYPQAAIKLGLEPPSFLPDTAETMTKKQVSNKKIKEYTGYNFQAIF